MATQRAGTVRCRNRRLSLQTLGLCTDLLWELDTDVSRRIASHLTAGDHAAAIAVDVDPRGYTDVDLLWRDWAAVNLVSKGDFLSLPGVDRAHTALKKFESAEESCRATNARLRATRVNPSIGLTGWSYIHTASRNISELLGPFSWDAAEEFFAFSHGASTRLTRRKGDPFYKYSGIPETTRSAAVLAITAIRRSPLWAAEMAREHGYDVTKWVSIVDGNRITTVPKNAKTDRVIAIEPCMNMFLQKGIGGLLRRKLKRVGINLDDQTLNQKYARLGSLDGSLSTIDLAAASDSISMVLVRQLLPDDWYEAIVSTRSEVGVLPNGEKIRYQKVSSMGNGYTFELESLIFWALARAVIQLHDVQDRRLAVYGDDIVIHHSVADVLASVLEFCGFSCNNEKTFVNGPFRESCGKHYYLGIDVTPLYVKEPIDTVVRLVWYLNSVRRWAARPTFPYADSRYRSYYDARRALLPNDLREPRIPDGVGDGALIGTFDEARPSYSRRRAQFQVDVLQEVRRKWRPDGPAAVLRFFQDTQRAPSEIQMQLVSRDSVRYIKSKMYLGQWGDTPFW